MDAILRSLMRLYAEEPSNENAHRLARRIFQVVNLEQTAERTSKRVIPIDRNLTLIITHDNTKILVSYTTPVAIETSEGDIFVTLTKHSRTTTKQINNWVQGKPFNYLSQEDINEIFQSY